jgi:hypothetical protein
VRDPLNIIEAERKYQRWFCEYLEKLADQLPNQIPKPDIETVYTTLKSKLPSYHRNEEALFSLIAEGKPSERVLDKTYTLIIEQHKIQQCFAEEFQDAFIESNFNQILDNCGYLLRYFFETITVHLDWEDLIFMPLAKNLKAADLDKLAGQISLASAGLIPKNAIEN